jgi:hypothetical protein
MKPQLTDKYSDNVLPAQEYHTPEWVVIYERGGVNISPGKPKKL